MGGTVDHPGHYQMAGMEVIDVIDAATDLTRGFCLGNALKYILRAGAKGDEVEDIRKAAWYLNYCANHLERKRMSDRRQDLDEDWLRVEVEVRLSRSGKPVATDAFIAEAPTYMQLATEIASANFDEAVQDMVSHVVSSAAGRVK